MFSRSPYTTAEPRLDLEGASDAAGLRGSYLSDVGESPLVDLTASGDPFLEDLAERDEALCWTAEGVPAAP